MSKQHCRHCSIGQYCFDIIAGVDRALLISGALHYGRASNNVTNMHQLTSQYDIMPYNMEIDRIVTTDYCHHHHCRLVEDRRAAP